MLMPARSLQRLKVLLAGIDIALFPHRERDGTGTLVFEDSSTAENKQLVDGPALGTLLTRTGVPILALNACRSAYAEAPTQPEVDDNANADVHARVRGYGSLALEVSDAGVPGVVAMRYSVYVVTAAHFVANMYASLLAGQELGVAVTAGRRQLAAQPNRTITFNPLPLQDWCVPVVYEASSLRLFAGTATDSLRMITEKQESNAAEDIAGKLPPRPDLGFFGRDETLLALDRAFTDHRMVLLHGYAGSGKTSTATEFARWYADTGGLADSAQLSGHVLFSSFEHHTPLMKLLNQLADELPALQEVEGQPWQTLTQRKRRDAAIQLLHTTPVLWIWDNIEPVTGFPVGTPLGMDSGRTG